MATKKRKEASSIKRTNCKCNLHDSLEFLSFSGDGLLIANTTNQSATHTHTHTGVFTIHTGQHFVCDSFLFFYNYSFDFLSYSLSMSPSIFLSFYSFNFFLLFFPPRFFLFFIILIPVKFRFFTLSKLFITLIYLFSRSFISCSFLYY